MIKTEIDRTDSISIEEVKEKFEQLFPEFTIRDYSLNDMLMLKKGIQKHEVKIYKEKIFIKSMIDANSSKIAFPILIFLCFSCLIQSFCFERNGHKSVVPNIFYGPVKLPDHTYLD